MHKLTKIVATLSDRNCSPQFIESLYHAGINVVRMNTAHLDATGMERIVANTRAVSHDIALMVDTKGPEVRTTVLAGDNALSYVPGMKATLAGEPQQPTSLTHIYLNYPDIARHVHPGDHLLIDDGELDFRIDAISGRDILATCLNAGTLGSRKSVNIPGVELPLESVTARDRDSIATAARLGVDFVAHSFVRSVADVEAVKEAVARAGGNMKVIAKIENQQGLDNFDAILDASYGIMIARGDLGIEVAAERIPALQSMMIRRCIRHHKPVIVATQMLHSMIHNPRPTRAEVSDVARAVEQRADALMLSGETANGLYPVEAVATMARIARETEKAAAGKSGLLPRPDGADVTDFLARQAVESQRLLGTRAIITDTYTGRTARYVAAFRGDVPTFAVCYNPEVKRWLALSYGVFALDAAGELDEAQCVSRAIGRLIPDDLLHPTAPVAYLGGRPGEGNKTSFLEIDTLDRIIKP